jgi:hypothetical protein
MVVLSQSYVSPVINLVLAAVALLAAWCIGIRFAGSVGAIMATSIVIFSPGCCGVGTAMAEMFVVAFTLSSIALLIAKDELPLPLVLASGIAAGLAVGAKADRSPDGRRAEPCRSRDGA